MCEEQIWITSPKKHILTIRETDMKTGQNKTIGYCRTKAEADHLIYHHGKKVFEQRRVMREKNNNSHHVTYSYVVGTADETTKFVIHEKSLGYFYNGPKTDRIIITFEKLFRTFNSQMTIEELESKTLKNELAPTENEASN